MLGTAIAARGAAATRLPLPPSGHANMTALDATSFDGIGSVVTLRSDKALFVEGEAARYCFKIVSGAVRSCKLLPDGRRQINRFLLPGDFVGLGSDGTYLSTIEAISDSILIRYPRQALDDLVERQPHLGKRLLALLCDDLSAAQAQMLLLGRKTAVERLASFLLSMSERNGDDDHVSLPMTRVDIADHLGLTIETVSRVFTQFKEKAVIELKGSSEVLLTDRDELEALADAV